MRTITAVCALGFAVLLPGEAVAQDAPLPPNAETAIGAATAFSVGYGVWLWEAKCKKLPPDEAATFNAAVTGQMQQLSAMLDLHLFQAILGAGQSTASDPDSAPPCDDAEALDFARFGVEMIKDAGDKIAQLPAGYHLTIAN